MNRPIIYTFLNPGDIMRPGDEYVQPFLTWSPIPANMHGKPVHAKHAQRVRRPVPELLTACEALHDALSNILENVDSPERDGKRPPSYNGDYFISRDMRAQAHWAIRKSFEALIKAKGEP